MLYFLLLLLKSKTVWTGLGTVIAAGATYAAGESSTVEAVTLAANGLMGIFIRIAIFKLKD